MGTTVTKTEQLHQDLDYIAATVRRNDRPSGVPAIYFLWALLVGIGFALPDFAPRAAAAYWLVAGVGGGILSAWLGVRDAKRMGFGNTELGRRHGHHWLVVGLGFAICWLPVLGGRTGMASMSGNFLLVAGLGYALAGVHLERPLLWSGLIMLGAFAVLGMFALPYTWTLTGVAIAIALAWAGLSAQRTRKAGALQ